MKKVSYPGGKKLTLRIASFEGGLSDSDENILPMRYAKEMYNYNVLGGNLKKSIGFCDFLDKFCDKNYLDRFKEKFLSLGKIVGIWHFKRYDNAACKNDDKLIFINEELQTYYINFRQDNTDFQRVYSLAFTSIPVAVNYRLNGEDVIIFSSKTDSMVVWDGINSAYSVLDAPKITSMALHYERLFVTVAGDKYAVWFSDDLDPTNWSVSLDEAGFVQMIDERGATEKIISFNDYLYVFRNQGISRITAYASQENFSLSHLFVSSSLIYKNTVCVCGNRVMFLAADGLYKFDGYDTVKVLSLLDNKFEFNNNSNACACYFNGKYYLACNFKFEENADFCDDKYLNNCLLEIDIDKMTFNIVRGVDIRYMSAVISENFKGVLVVTGNSQESVAMLDDSGTLFGDVLKKRWISPFTDLGYSVPSKVIRQVALTTTNPLTMIIKSEKMQEVVCFNGSFAPQTKQVMVAGEKFRFEFYSESKDVEVSNVEIMIKVES